MERTVLKSPTLGGRIRELRKLKGLTLDGLTAKCGIAKPNLSRIENGRVYPVLGTLMRIAEGLGVKPSAFIRIGEVIES